MSPAASPKLAAYSGLAALGLLAALVLARPEPLALAAPFVLALAVGLGLSREPALRFACRLDRERALEGEAARLEIECAAETPMASVELWPYLPRGLESADERRVLAFSLDAGERRTLRYRIQCRRWGAYRLGAILLRARDRAGLLVFETWVDARLPLRVYPRAETLRAALRPADTQVFTGNEVSRHKGAGIEFAEIREFVPGDRVRRINWRASARRGHLYVNEQHPERNADVVLFLDTFMEVAEGGVSTLDLMVRAAASLAAFYLERRDRVGVIGFGGFLRWLVPAMGQAQLYRIVESLLDTHVTLSYVWKDVDIIPRRTLPPKALVVALTPLIDERIVRALLDLRARRFDLAIVEISPLAFVRAEDSDAGRLAYRLWKLRRDVLRSRFQGLGVPVAVWERGEPLEAAIEEVRGFRRYARQVHA